MLSVRRTEPLLHSAGPRPRRRPVPVPTVRQMAQAECGSVALSMVLGAHGRFAPSAELRAACDISRNGSRASNILRAARAYGLNAKGFRTEPTRLRSLPLPAILHWRFNHFVVLRGFRRNGSALIVDPALGPRTITAEELDTAFTGVVLVFEPSASFQAEGSRPSLSRALRKYLPAATHVLLLAVALGGLAMVLRLILPGFSRVYIDSVVSFGSPAWLSPLLLGMTGVGLLLLGASWIRRDRLLALETEVSLTRSAEFMQQMLCLPVSFFLQRTTGELVSRLRLFDRLSRLLTRDLTSAALDIVVMCGLWILMATWDIRICLVVTAVAAVNLGVLAYVARRRRDLSVRLAEERGQTVGAGLSGIRKIESLKAMGLETDFIARWSGYYARVLNARHELALQTLSLSVLPAASGGIAFAGLLMFGGVGVMDGTVSGGELLVYYLVMLMFLAPVDRLVALGAITQEIEGDLFRIDDVARTGGEPEAEEEVRSGPPPRRVELRRVSFGYSRSGPPLVQGIDLEIEPGSRVGVVGATGSGKSTLGRLVLGLYQPWSGEILFDGRPRESFGRSGLKGPLAMVDQQICLFEGTVLENLTLWDDSIPFVAVERAARDAVIHDDILGWEGGYNARIEEAGRNLSGGQRQRLEIARGLVLDPTILVLDEATSALDPLTERLIEQRLRARRCTCLVIAHRLSTVRDCEEIVVLADGQVVERGNHHSLMRRGGRYHHLVRAQEPVAEF